MIHNQQFAPTELNGMFTGELIPEEASYAETDLRILALSHSSNLAGAQLALASLVKNTASEVEWTVVCPDDGALGEVIEPYADVKHTKYPWWCKGKNFTPTPAPLGDIVALNTLLDDVDSNLALTNTITVPWLAHNARRRNLPHVWYIHEYGDRPRPCLSVRVRSLCSIH